MTAYQLLDYKSTNADAATFVAFDKKERLLANQFVIVECPDRRKYLGIVASAGLNIGRDALDPIDNTSLNQMEMIASGRLSRDVAIKEAWLYGIRLLLDVTAGGSDSVLIRPLSAARASVASDSEIVQHLGLPPINREAAIGTIINSSVPICVSRETMVHHIMVAGTTGSGSRTRSPTCLRLRPRSACAVSCGITSRTTSTRICPTMKAMSLGKGCPTCITMRLVGTSASTRMNAQSMCSLGNSMSPCWRRRCSIGTAKRTSGMPRRILLTTYYNDRDRQARRRSRASPPGCAASTRSSLSRQG